MTHLGQVPSTSGAVRPLAPKAMEAEAARDDTFNTQEMHMRDIRRAPAKIIVTAWLMACGIRCIAAPQAMESQTRSGRETLVGEEFHAVLAKVDAAQLELQNGRRRFGPMLMTSPFRVDSAANRKRMGTNQRSA